jgi:hypothetical protein
MLQQHIAANITANNVYSFVSGGTTGTEVLL